MPPPAKPTPAPAPRITNVQNPADYLRGPPRGPPPPKR